MAITKRQRQVYDFISDFVQKNGYSPSFEEIGEGMGLNSLATVHKHISNLEKKGLLTRDYNRSRSIDLLPPKGRLKQSMAVNTAMVLPLLGRIAAGQPIEAVQNPETISLADFVRSKEVFVLEVRGDSMQDEHILNGDYVLVEKSQTAHNGDIVVALVDGTDATLKRFYHEGDNDSPAALECEHAAHHCGGGGSGDAGPGDRGAAEVLSCCDWFVILLKIRKKRPEIFRTLLAEFGNLADVLVERLLNRLFGHVTHDLLFHLPALEHQQGRDAANAVAHGSGAVAVHVHLADFDLALILGGEFIHDRSDGATRATPSRPEIHQHGLFRLQHVLVEIRIIHFNNRFACHRSSV